MANVLDDLDEQQAAELIADLEFGNAGVFHGGANPDIDIGSLRERFKTMEQRDRFVILFKEAIGVRLTNYMEKP